MDENPTTHPLRSKREDVRRRISQPSKKRTAPVRKTGKRGGLFQELSISLPMLSRGQRRNAPVPKPERFGRLGWRLMGASCDWLNWRDWRVLAPKALVPQTTCAEEI